MSSAGPGGRPPEPPRQLPARREHTSDTSPLTTQADPGRPPRQSPTRREHTSGTPHLTTETDPRGRPPRTPRQSPTQREHTSGTPHLTTETDPRGRPPRTPRQSPTQTEHTSGTPHLTTETDPGRRPPRTPRQSPTQRDPLPAGPASPASGERAAVLAIDGGNSKTDIALVAADGTLLASGRAPGVRTFPTQEVLDAIGATISAAAREAGLATGWPVAAQTVACMANADLPEEEAQLAAMLAAEGWGASTEVANDTFAVLRAGLVLPAGRPWGVAVTCGAGINCVGVAPDGRSTGFLALGTITGDWGGGLGLGREALWWAIRAEDGRGRPTALRQAVAAHFGLPTVRDVAISIHQGRIDCDDVAGLGPAVLTLAGGGDAVACDLVRRLADEVCVMVSTVIGRLGLGQLDTPVVLGGGMLTARDPLLNGSITQRLATQVPAAQVQVVPVPPIAGAALLGLDHLSAAPAAEQHLRAAYQARTQTPS